MIWARLRHFLASKAVDGLIWVAYRINRRRAKTANLQQELPAHARITTSAPPAQPKRRAG